MLVSAEQGEQESCKTNSSPNTQSRLKKPTCHRFRLPVVKTAKYLAIRDGPGYKGEPWTLIPERYDSEMCAVWMFCHPQRAQRKGM